jgi:hypothetical protein
LISSGLKTRPVLRSLGNHYHDLAEAQRSLGRAADAAATLFNHQELWAGNPDELYDLACGLALCIPIAANSQNGPTTPEQRAECDKYGDWAMAALGRAVAAGFSDAAHMNKDADLAPLRVRAEFQALVREIRFPRDPFAR